MADEQDDTERSEDPTQKRLDEALERGDVVKSQEVNTWFVLAAATLILLSFSGSMSSAILTMLRGILGACARHSGRRARPRAAPCRRSGFRTIAAVALPFALLALAAIAGNMIQHRLVWSAESLKPKLSKISLGAGFKRLFSKIALANFVKGLIKLALIGTVMTVILWPKRHQLDGLVTMDPAVVLPLVKSMSLDCSAP